jgi:hypothetical protein
VFSDVSSVINNVGRGSPPMTSGNISQCKEADAYLSIWGSGVVIKSVMGV